MSELLNNINQYSKWINVNKHPTEDLYIYKYNKECSYKRCWNDVTMMCRGLILDSQGNIKARPFTKFFNYEELEDLSIIPNEPFEVYEKLDGSLGIMYWVNDVPYLATPGSFVSEQAIHGTKILHTKYKNYLKDLDPSKTYLFEIIYPEDKHIVSYGDLDDLILLAVFDTETGVELNILQWEYIFITPKKYENLSSFLEIRDKISGENKEGYVIKFQSGFRIKLKYAEWFKQNFLKSYLTPKTVYTYLSQGKEKDLLEYINKFDEENQIYCRDLIDYFYSEYKRIELEAISYYKEFDSDKDAALYFKSTPYSAILFSKRHNKNYSKIIWKLIKY